MKSELQSNINSRIWFHLLEEMMTNLKKLPFDQEYHQDQVIHEDQEDPEIKSNWINTNVF